MDKTCNSCKSGELSTITMSGAQFEAMEARHERREKRHVFLIALLIALLVGSNLAWLIYESQFEEVVTTEEITLDAVQDGEGVNIVGGGNVDYGTESENKNKEDNKNPY